MHPGVYRAIPMGIMGFLAGAALVVLSRWLIGMNQIWDAQLAIIGGGFMSAFFFMWGIGAFNSKLSEHHIHEPPEDADDSVLALPPAEHHDEEAEKPANILGGQIWTIATWTLIMMLVIAVFAFMPGGLAMTTSSDPNATANAIGTFEVELFGQPFVLDQLTVLILFSIFTFFSLIVTAGLIGWVFAALSKNVTEAKKMQPVPLANYSLTGAISTSAGGAATLPASTATGEAAAEEAAAAEPRKPLLRRIPKWVWFIVLVAVLYPTFYYVAIGLILPNPQLPGLTDIIPDPKIQLAILSIVNAVAIAIPIVYPVFALRMLGVVAGWLAKVLRGIPAFLGQK